MKGRALLVAGILLALVFAGLPVAASAEERLAMTAPSADTTTPAPAATLPAKPAAQAPPEADPRPALGVILPLSGRYGEFGALVRQGVELALETPGAPLRPIFRDVGPEPEQNVRAVADLASDPAVLAIVGPLTSGAALAAAGEAERARIPLLTLSPREGLPAAGAYVFRLSLTSRAQVRALAEYAVGSRRIATFGILAPQDKLGREMADLFTREVEQRGGKVVARQDYAEADTDFRRPIRLLQGLDPVAPEPEPPKPGAPLPPRPVPFQGLFIPDAAERVGLIAPQLAYYGIVNAQLLGTSGWNSPELLRRGGRFVEGAIFVDGFFRDSPWPQVQEFVTRYAVRFTEEPALLEAQGNDAAGILLSLAAQPENRNREALRTALAGLRHFPGVTGTTSFDAQGEAQRPLFLLQVQNGEIVQLNDRR